MTQLLRVNPIATPAMLEVWSDAAVIAHALAFETALARAQADVGLLVLEEAEAVARACAVLSIDAAELAHEAAQAGTLAIPLVQRLRTVAPAAHAHATSQDLADTVLMLQARCAAALLVADAERIGGALRAIAELHAATPAVGRTLLQDALPIGWGLRVAQWRVGIIEAARRLRNDVAQLPVQLGGAAGARAGMNGKGAPVASRIAAALGLSPAPPWHARRTVVVALAGSLGMLIGALAKMARDVSLLAQNSVGEAREPLEPGRGGSSAMAHKRNPTGCQVALTAQARAPGLVAGVLAAMPAEEERGLASWQADGPMLAELFLLASGTAAAMARVAEGLEVDEAAIARNLAASELGVDLGESAVLTAELLERED